MQQLVLNPNLIEALFERTNFGGAEKTDVGRRGLMVDCVLKRAAGYHDGHTIHTICEEAGLLTNEGKPRKAALRWAFDQLYKSSAPTTLERLQNARLTGTQGTDPAAVFSADEVGPQQ